MTRLLLIQLLLFCTTFAFSQSYHPQFQKTFGGIINDMTTDSDGNVLVAGRGTVGKSCLGETLSENQGSAYLAKIDPAGNLLWRLNVGGSAEANGVAVDSAGNIFITGNFEKDALFSADVVLDFYIESNGGNDIFVLKVSPDGEPVWVVQAGGRVDDYGYDIATDSVGNLFITGGFKWTVDFFPGDAGTRNLVSSDFEHNPFVWSLTNDGDFRWARKHLSPAFSSFGYRIAVDENGDVVSTGRYNNFDLAITSFYVWKARGNNGSQLFQHIFTGTDAAIAHGIATDSENNIIVTGQFGRTMDFDPGADTVALTAPEWWKADAFILKLNESGNFVWVKKTGRGSGYDTANAVAVNASDDIYVTGRFRGTVDFDPGVGVFNLSTSVEGNDVYTQVLDSDGNFIYAHDYGFTQTSDDEGWAVAVAPDGKFYSGGVVWGGPYQGRMQAYGSCLPRDTIIRGCRSVDYNGMEFTSNCSFRELLPSVDSTCDTILNISIQLDAIRPPSISNFDSVFFTNDFGDPLQWLDCDDNFSPILGDTLSEFVATETGSYAVEVIYPTGCRDTSECVFIQIGTSDVSEKLDIFAQTEVFPNPFFEKINLKKLPTAFAEISLFDLNGKMIFEKEKAAGVSEIEISTDDFSNGIYVVFIKSEKGIFRKLITKKR